MSHPTPSPSPSPRPERRPPRLPWSEQELEALREYCAQSLEDAEIARRLGRTTRAVRTMILRSVGERRRDPFRPWTTEELETARRLHAAGALCAVIAQALPGRTPVAVFRKLCRLVGPAPSADAKRSWRQAKRTAPPPAPAPDLIRTATPTPKPPPAPVPASLDTLVRWLRSRDFVVLRKGEGWRIDHHQLDDDGALVAFVNLRRARLHMPPFVLAEPAEPRIIPAAIASAMVRGRRWGRPLARL